MECSVIIATYNRQDLLRQTLDCLRYQSHEDISFEVVVVDDGSSDNTFFECMNFSSVLNIKYVWQADHGFRVSESRNNGIKIASGGICIFLDAGIIVDSYFVQTHCDTHRKLSSVAAVGEVCGLHRPTHTKVDEDLQMELIEDYIAKMNTQFPDIRQGVFWKTGYSLQKFSSPWTLFWGGNCSVKKNHLIEAGLFDENMTGWGGEDIDLGYRLHRIGVHTIGVMGALAYHIAHPEDSEQKRNSALHNYEYLASKHQCDIFRNLDGASIEQVVNMGTSVDLA